MWVLVFLPLTLLCLICIPKKVHLSENTDIQSNPVSDTSVFTLRKGDILVRPNWGWFPGSCSIKNGRRYGHVAIVTEPGEGKTIEEALSKASVIEALFFDQGTRKFQFDKKDQIRERKAIVSFGKRFKGIRYRLRMNLTDDQTNKIISFLKNQLDGGYDLLSSKIKYKSESERESALSDLKEENWHCATLIWEAYYLAANIDIDANRGFIIYPADIIPCRYFELPGGRICF